MRNQYFTVLGRKHFNFTDATLDARDRETPAPINVYTLDNDEEGYSHDTTLTWDGTVEEWVS
jgi:hypothetical protein